jgi:hypothetical protein
MAQRDLGLFGPLARLLVPQSRPHASRRQRLWEEAVSDWVGEKEKERNGMMAILLYYAIWWEDKTVQRKVGRKFWQKP